ncbi:hypothetical protein [Microtetraspora niveoalba]|uniref:hypothetical protein n=1 Tax=Microtetraspora niveoalba TaxID=46175 RepID=UPI00082CDBD6|nr:hypothetical protein [Microtetraspora niveoalba]
MSSLAFLAVCAIVAIALMLAGHWLWWRRLYVFAVLAAFVSAVAVFLLVARWLLLAAGAAS